MATNEPIVPEVLVNGRRVVESEGWFSFPAVIQTVDHYAKRIPWWVWLAAGLFLGKGGTSLISRIFGRWNAPRTIE